jgi:hypothetical protein
LPAAGTGEWRASDANRFAPLAAVAEVADGRLTLEDTAIRVCELVLPEFADICVLDVVHEGGLRRLAVKISGQDAAALESRFRDRPLPVAEEPGVGMALSRGAPQLLRAFSDEAFAGDGEGRG